MSTIICELRIGEVLTFTQLEEVIPKIMEGTVGLFAGVTPSKTNVSKLSLFKSISSYSASVKAVSEMRGIRLSKVKALESVASETIPTLIGLLVVIHWFS
ncbi:MAG: hypothetical protein P8P11_00380, partial [Burkholderiales bacterium]|nr:hypothetical protein [Burkholderiales bacterium]